MTSGFRAWRLAQAFEPSLALRLVALVVAVPEAAHTLARQRGHCGTDHDPDKPWAVHRPPRVLDKQVRTRRLRMTGNVADRLWPG